MSVPLNIDLKNKVAVVTGGGGILCSSMAAALAECGRKGRNLDLRLENAQKAAEAIKKNGGEAIGIAANVLEKESLLAAHQAVKDAYGPCDILINGAGGNHPKGTTSGEFATKADAEGSTEGKISFFDLDPAGVGFVFNLNFIGTLLPTQVFARDMALNGHGIIINISSMNAFRPLTKIPAYSGAQGGGQQLYPVACNPYVQGRHSRQCDCPGIFPDRSEPGTLLTNADGSLTARGNTILTHTPMGRFGTPEDLLGTLLWLADDKASGFVNGAVIPVDGRICRILRSLIR